MKCSSSANSRMDANMQLTINSFRPLFPDKIFSHTFPWLLVKSLTAVKFPDISRQVVTLLITYSSWQNYKINDTLLTWRYEDKRQESPFQCWQESSAYPQCTTLTLQLWSHCTAHRQVLETGHVTQSSSAITWMTHSITLHFCRSSCFNLSATNKTHVDMTHSLYHSVWLHSRKCEIPWQLLALLRGTRHVNCYSYYAHTSATASCGGRNARVNDLKSYI